MPDAGSPHRKGKIVVRGGAGVVERSRATATFFEKVRTDMRRPVLGRHALLADIVTCLTSSERTLLASDALTTAERGRAVQSITSAFPERRGSRCSSLA